MQQPAIVATGPLGRSRKSTGHSSNSSDHNTANCTVPLVHNHSTATAADSSRSTADHIATADLPPCWPGHPHTANYSLHSSQLPHFMPACQAAVQATVQPVQMSQTL